MKYETPLIPGTLLRRYKRFLSDIQLEDGREVVAHCANPGAMTGLATPGTRVWVEPNDDPKRKLKFSWKLCELEGGFANIDTSSANKLVAEALAMEAIPELAAYGGVRAEVKYGEKSRVDFLLSEAGLPDLYLEVKSVTLMREARLAEFPDTVTTRGAKHLAELGDMVRAGHRAVLFFVVNRTDCREVCVARDIDPAYAEAFERAVEAGVEVVAYDAEIGPLEIRLRRRCEVRFTN